MTENKFKTYEELPLFLNAKMIGQVLGISPVSAYELLHQKNFPILKIGNRLVVHKEKFIQWVEQKTAGGEQ